MVSAGKLAVEGSRPVVTSCAGVSACLQVMFRT